METIKKLKRQFDALDNEDYNYKQTGASQQDKDKFSENILKQKKAIIKQIVALENKQAVNNSKPINKGDMIKKMNKFVRGAGKIYTSELGNRVPIKKYKL